MTVIAMGMIAVCLCGCTLLDRVTDFNNPEHNHDGELPGIRRPVNSVGLELVFVERPVNDPLLKPARLWEGVDTVGELTQEVRKRLHDNGFRVGHSSSTPNDALETLLGLSSADPHTPAPVARNQLAGRRIYRPVGGNTEIQTSRLFPEFIASPAEPDARRLEFQNARCLLRVKVLRVGKGWAELEFTPEIHHGRHVWRPMATGMGYQRGTTSQKVHHLYDHRFRLTLNVGEMAILTADPSDDETTGARFFAGSDGKQRVIIVRVADIAAGRAEQR